MKRVYHGAPFVGEQLLIIGDAGNQKSEAVAEKCDYIVKDDFIRYFRCQNLTYTPVRNGIFTKHKKYLQSSTKSSVDSTDLTRKLRPQQVILDNLSKAFQRWIRT